MNFIKEVKSACSFQSFVPRYKTITIESLKKQREREGFQEKKKMY